MGEPVASEPRLFVGQVHLSALLHLRGIERCGVSEGVMRPVPPFDALQCNGVLDFVTLRQRSNAELLPNHEGALMDLERNAPTRLLRGTLAARLLMMG